MTAQPCVRVIYHENLVNPFRSWKTESHYRLNDNLMSFSRQQKQKERIPVVKSTIFTSLDHQSVECLIE